LNSVISCAWSVRIQSRGGRGRCQTETGVVLFGRNSATPPGGKVALRSVERSVDSAAPTFRTRCSFKKKLAWNLRRKLDIVARWEEFLFALNKKCGWRLLKTRQMQCSFFPIRLAPGVLLFSKMRDEKNVHEGLRVARIRAKQWNIKLRCKVQLDPSHAGDDNPPQFSVSAVCSPCGFRLGWFPVFRVSGPRIRVRTTEVSR
jgi:hypothetical protein